jgi:hypothetical protein
MMAEEKEDIAWREFNIHHESYHYGEPKDKDTDEYDEDEDYNDNQEFMFQLFDKPDDEETTEYKFPNVPMISLRGKSEYTNSTGL